MAGGEGTRLRPLTSNQPKPMLPMANRPDDGARRQPAAPARLRGHRGHRGLHGQRHPHLLRRRLRVRRAHGLRHRGDPARHGRLGAQRPRRARRALPRHLRRRAHRHRPDARWSTSTSQGGAWPPSPSRRSTTRSSSASSSPARTARSSASSRSPPGARSSATPSTPASTCSSPRSSTSSPRAGRSTSPRRSSPPCSRPASPCSATWPTATGRTSAPSRPTCGPTRTSSTRRSPVAGQRVPAAARGLAGQGGRGRPDGRGPTARPSSATTAISAPGARPRRVLRARCQRPHRGQRRRSSAPSSTTTPSWAPGSASTAASSAGPATSARGCAARRAWSSATSASSGAHAVIKSGVKVYPFKTVEAGATVNSSIVWESTGRPVPVRPRRASRAWPTSTSAPSWPCACRWPGRRTLEKGARHRLPRHQPGRPGAQAGHHGRLQRRRGQRRRPRGRHRAGHPVPGPLGGAAWAASPSGSSTTTPSRS